MDFDKYYININGKKEQLKNIEGPIRKDLINKNFSNLFAAYDTDNNNTLDRKELNEVLAGFKTLSYSRSAKDMTLDERENALATTIFENQFGIENADFMGFVKSLSDAGEIVEKSSEKINGFGMKIVTTEYKDGTTEIITYNQFEEFVSKKTIKKIKDTIYTINVNGESREITEEEHNKIKEQYETLLEIDKNLSPNNNSKIFSDENKFNIEEPESRFSSSLTSKTEESTIVKEIVSANELIKNLGLFSTDKEAEKICERFNLLPEEAKEIIKDGIELREILKTQNLPVTFENVSNILELSFGVSIRTEEEMEANEPKLRKLQEQAQNAEILASTFEMIGEWHNQFTDNSGLVALGAQGILHLANIIGLPAASSFQISEMCEKIAEYIRNRSLNENEFNELYKRLTNGKPYNPEYFNKLQDLVDNGKAYDENGEYTDEYKNALENVLGGLNIWNPNTDTALSIISGIGEIVLLLLTLGSTKAISGLKALSKSSTKAFSKFGVKVATKQVGTNAIRNSFRLSGKAIKHLGLMAKTGTKMGLYTFTTGTISNTINRIAKEESWDKFYDKELEVAKSAAESFTFGAFAEGWGSMITSRVTKWAADASKRVEAKISSEFSKATILDGDKVLLTAIETSAPTTKGKIIEFVSNLVGFTLTDTALKLAEGVYNEEDFTKILWEEFKHEGYSLGQITFVSHLLMYMLSAKNGTRTTTFKALENDLPELKGVKIEKTKSGYNVTLTNGHIITCQNTTEMLSNLCLITRGETSLGTKFNNFIDGRYTSFADQYTKIGDKIFRIKLKDVANKQTEISEIKKEIEEYSKTNLKQAPEEAKELQIILETMTNPKPFKDMSKTELDNHINAINNFLDKHYSMIKDFAELKAGEFGLKDPNLGKFSNRVKRLISTKDKLNNFVEDALKKDKNTTKTLLDAMNDVRDKIGWRTSFPEQDYSKHPEIVEILKSGAPDAKHKAELRAAEIQSQEVLNTLKDVILTAQKRINAPFIFRISNYTSPNGIPILSEAQIKELQDIAGKEHIQITKNAPPEDPFYSKMKESVVTKSQPSGYTALQVNFETEIGDRFEWQYRGKFVNDFAEAEHIPYDIRTNKEPWKEAPEKLKPLYDMILEANAKIPNKKGSNPPEKDPNAINLYNQYLTDYYAHLRRLELGFETQEPRLKDYNEYIDAVDNVPRKIEFDSRLSADNLKLLHKYIEDCKKGKITTQNALNKFNEEYIKEL